MRLIFFGTPDFASRCLRKILSSKHEVAAVVTAPDRPKGRGRVLAQPEVKKLALEHGLEVLQPERLKSHQFLDRLGSIDAGIFCVVAFRILPEEVFTMPSSGCVNLHASLLPAYRGAAPINWALINGERETGLTTFFIRREVDTGDIIMQEKVAIGPDEVFGELHDRMAEQGADLLIRTIDLIESGDFETWKQDGAKATPAPKLSPEIGLIDWGKSAVEIHNLIRGLSPRPGAFSFLEGRKLVLIRSRVIDEGKSGDNPGTVISADSKSGISVVCGRGAVAILELKPESGNIMSGAEFVRGYRLKSGALFEAGRRASHKEEN